MERLEIKFKKTSLIGRVCSVALLPERCSL